jgi:hypothetical protein
VRKLPAFVLLFALGCGGAPVPETAEPDEEAPAPRLAVALRLVDEGESEGVPHTRVSFVRILEHGSTWTEELGVEPGACFAVPPGPSTLLAAECWWGPARARYVLRRDGDELVATRSGPQRARVELLRARMPEGVLLQAVGDDGHRRFR